MNQKRWEHLGPTVLIMSVSVGCLIGLTAGKWPWLWWLSAGLAGWWGMRHPRLVLPVGCLFLCGLGLGWWRAEQTSHPLRELSEVVGEQVELRGIVLDDPSYADHGQTEAYLGDVRLRSSSVEIMLPGKTRLRGFVLNLARGDQVVATGKIRAGFGSYVASLYYADIRVARHDTSWLHNLRNRFQIGLLNSLPEPQASFAFGLLVGARSTLPEKLNTELSIVGLTHLVAVSGYNLTIIIRAVRWLCRSVSPFISLVASVILIMGFVLVTGFSASIVRAAIVAGLSLAAWYYGRPIKPEVLLTTTAAATALVNPLYIWGDLGWYLSFLAFVGILLIAPAIHERLADRKPRLWRQLLIETMSAVVMTTPLIMFVFGRVSLIAPLSNLLIVPLVPLGMLLCFIGGLTGVWLPRLSGLIALPARWLLGTITKLIEQLAALPWSQQQISMSKLQLTASYISIGLAYWFVSRQQRSNHGKLPVIDEEF